MNWSSDIIQSLQIHRGQTYLSHLIWIKIEIKAEKIINKISSAQTSYKTQFVEESTCKIATMPPVPSRSLNSESISTLVDSSFGFISADRQNGEEYLCLFVGFLPLVCSTSRYRGSTWSCSLCITLLGYELAHASIFEYLSKAGAAQTLYIFLCMRVCMRACIWQLTNKHHSLWDWLTERQRENYEHTLTSADSKVTGTQIDSY